ncbi:hypothetical protein XNC1_4574 [Xenorhabdus nematophila ATCC 19061]|uniref:Uncharacterized protein n=1 Tax=Xenorhabdus nematophila (strain ATCC 19061 / DSM 3370 / CCUG 14189 / LMG 1036 / NCIMB 9965 / AN6) TaxID=406817 RepID=D3VFT0_XENNA|nr:hypothetical protein XNC1_4574 [Xenorhabdus nematophila ATCC 19061]
MRMTLAVDDYIISVPLKPDDGEFPFHPHIECIMQEQIGQQRTNDPSLRRPLVPYLHRSIRHVHRRG